MSNWHRIISIRIPTTLGRGFTKVFVAFPFPAINLSLIKIKTLQNCRNKNSPKTGESTYEAG